MSMKEEQLSKFNSDLSNIEKEIKNIQDKYTGKDKVEMDSKDTEFLLSILDRIDERLSHLDDGDEDEEIENENEN
jgi:hypothetical protein